MYCVVKLYRELYCLRLGHPLASEPWLIVFSIRLSMTIRYNTYMYNFVLWYIHKQREMRQVVSNSSSQQPSQSASKYEWARYAEKTEQQALHTYTIACIYTLGTVCMRLPKRIPYKHRSTVLLLLLQSYDTHHTHFSTRWTFELKASRRVCLSARKSHIFYHDA